LWFSFGVVAAYVTLCYSAKVTVHTSAMGVVIGFILGRQQARICAAHHLASGLEPCARAEGALCRARSGSTAARLWEEDGAVIMLVRTPG